PFHGGSTGSIPVRVANSFGPSASERPLSGIDRSGKLTRCQPTVDRPPSHSQEVDEGEIGVDQCRFQQQEHDEAQNSEAEIKKVFDLQTLNPFLFLSHISRGGNSPPIRSSHQRDENTSDDLMKTSVASDPG